MQFNKLYNLILQSIINQNKAQRKQLIGNLSNYQQIQKMLSQYPNKTADFLAKYFASKELTDINDPRIEQVYQILKRKTDYNTNKIVTLKEFLKQNETFYKRQQDKQTASEIIDYIDKNVPEFSQKTQLKNGVITYKVEDSKKAQKAVRKIIDLCWGTSANPWCLASRKGGINVNYNNYWNQYNAYPKHIAFQNGKLLAFSANDSQKNVWWNRQDHSTDQLELLDHSFMNTPKYEWSPEQKVNRFLEKHKAILSYDSDSETYNTKRSSIVIHNQDLIDGKLPVKFGVIGGDFECNHCSELISLQNSPTNVVGNFDIDYCFKLSSLVGGPKYVGYFSCTNCNGLTNLQGAPEEVYGDVYYECCDSLTSLIGGPRIVKGEVRIDGCSKLKSFQGAPEEVDGEFWTENLDSLISCKGLPKLIKKDCWIQFCDNLKSLDCPKTVIKGNFNIRACPKLKSLANGPVQVGKRLRYGWNEILQITKEDKQKYKLLEKQGRWQCDE